MLLLFLVVYQLYRPEQRFLQPDAEGYLNFSAIRTGGYYVTVQLGLYALCTAMVGWRMVSRVKQHPRRGRCSDVVVVESSRQ